MTTKIVQPIPPNFTLADTSLSFGTYRKAIDSSESLGWSDMIVVLAGLVPYTDTMRAVSSVWISTPLYDMKAEVEKEGRGRNGVIPQRSILITAPGVTTHISLSTPSVAFSAFVREHVLKEVADEIFGRQLDAIEILSPTATKDTYLGYLMRASEHMLDEPEDGQWRSDYLARAMAAQVLVRHAQLRDVPAVAESRAPLSAAQVRAINDFMNSNLHGKFQFSDLAKSVGMSKTIFYERFACTMKQTPHQFLQKMRIERAKLLLGDGKLSLASVASACGFSDQSHMTRFFKRYLGTTPARYRREMLR